MGLEGQDTKAEGVKLEKTANSTPVKNNPEPVPSASMYTPVLGALVQAVQIMSSFGLEQNQIWAKIQQSLDLAYAGGTQDADGTFHLDQSKGLIFALQQADINIGKERADGIKADMDAAIGAAAGAGVGLAGVGGSLGYEKYQSGTPLKELQSAKSLNNDLIDAEGKVSLEGQVGAPNTATNEMGESATTSTSASTETATTEDEQPVEQTEVQLEEQQKNAKIAKVKEELTNKVIRKWKQGESDYHKSGKGLAKEHAEALQEHGLTENDIAEHAKARLTGQGSEATENRAEVRKKMESVQKEKTEEIQKISGKSQAGMQTASQILTPLISSSTQAAYSIDKQKATAAEAQEQAASDVYKSTQQQEASTIDKAEQHADTEARDAMSYAQEIGRLQNVRA